MSEERVLEALSALREADRDCEAGPQVEIRLMQAVTRKHRVRIWSRAGLGLAAAATASFLLLHFRKVEAIPMPPPATPVIAQSIPALVAPAIAVAAVKPKRRAVPKPRVPREVTTDFYPLMELAPPFERGELVRVTVPASTLRDVGILVNASHMDDPVEADVLIGQEGLARAIRFVSYQ